MRRMATLCAGVALTIAACRVEDPGDQALAIERDQTGQPLAGDRGAPAPRAEPPPESQVCDFPPDPAAPALCESAAPAPCGEVAAGAPGAETDARAEPGCDPEPPAPR